MMIGLTNLFCALLALAACAEALGQSKQDLPVPAPSQASPMAGQEPFLANPQPAAPSAVSAEKRERLISASLAAQLADGAPRYSPPPPPSPRPAPEVDERDLDKPRNEIIRLPSKLVREKRPEVFTEKELTSSKGRTDLGFKAHPGLGIGNLFGLNAPVAADMAAEQERLDDIRDLAETARAIDGGGDSGEGRYILRATQDAFFRSEIPTWKGPGSGDGRP
jgi:hypothetical protein